MKLRIIIDATTTQDQFRYHGVGQYTKNLIKEMLRCACGFDFQILLFDGKSTLDKFFDESNFDNYSIVRIGKKRPNNYLNKLWYYTQIYPAVMKLKTPDSIYFCPYFWRHYPAQKIKTVLMVHDLTLPELNIYSARKGISNLIRRAQYWNALRPCRNCEAIITNSHFTKNDLLRYLPSLDADKIHPIHLASESFKLEHDAAVIDKYLPQDWAERGYIIYLGGALTKNKNSMGVLKAYSELKRLFELSNSSELRGANEKNNSRHRLLPYLAIAGTSFTRENDPRLLELHEYISQNKLDGDVVFTGYYEDEDKSHLLNGAITFIHLSTYEGFGLPVLEALSAGVPVIAHDGTSFPEVLENAGILVDGTKPTQVAKKLYEVITNKELRKSLVEKGLRQAAKFSWEKTAKKTLHVLNSVAAG